MNIKAAGLIVISAILIATPAIAVESSATAKPSLQQRVESRTQKIDSRIAQIQTSMQEKMIALEQRRMAEASKSAMFRQKFEIMKERIASHEASVKAKIQLFKDKQKSQIAERINTNLNKINQNQTSQMLRHLEKMSQLLDRLEERVNSNSPDIKDPTLTMQAIAEARKAIEDAKKAVEEQALADYTINVTTETNIKEDAKAQREKLHKDIKEARKLVIDAKQAVSNAVRVAKSGKIATSSAELKEGSASGQQ